MTAFLLMLALLLPLQPLTKTATPTAIVQQLFEAYQKLDIDAMSALMAPEIRFEDPTFRLRANGKAEWRKMADASRAAMVSMAAKVHSTLQSGNSVAIEYTMSGRLKVEDDIREINVRCASFFSVEGALITRWTDYCDYRTFTEQTRRK